MIANTRIAIVISALLSLAAPSDLLLHWLCAELYAHYTNLFARV